MRSSRRSRSSTAIGGVMGATVRSRARTNQGQTARRPNPARPRGDSWWGPSALVGGADRRNDELRGGCAPTDAKAARKGSMFQVRVHGRGGQGVVTAAELLAVAAFDDGRFSQAFPTFGSERTGAPVVSFCRIDEKEIRTRAPIAEPDALIIQDPTLLGQPGLFSGLRSDGYLVINTSKSIAELGLGRLALRLPAGHVLAIGATELAIQHLGRPLPNAVMLGGFAAATGVVSLSAVVSAIEERFSGSARAGNVAAAREAYRIACRQTQAEAREAVGHGAV
jgi:pyruvate ferredoxin oxidoreductase gamma subunit